MKYYYENPQPFTISKEYTISSYEIYNILLVPLHSAVVQVYFYDDRGVKYERSFRLVGEEYSNWTSDDYLYDYINNKDNFMRIFDK